MWSFQYSYSTIGKSGLVYISYFKDTEIKSNLYTLVRVLLGMR